MSSTEWKIKNKDRMKEWSKQYYWQNRDKVLAQQKLRQQEKKEEIKSQKVKYRATHKAEISARDQTPSRRMSTARSMAKKRGHIWTLTLEQYSEIISKDCYYCEGYFGKTLKGSGCDRINNDLGYSVDNVLSCCGFCNRLRSNVMTVDECKALITLLVSMRKEEAVKYLKLKAFW